MIKTEIDPLGIKEYVSSVPVQDKLNVINAILNADKIKISIDREDERTRQLTDEYIDSIAAAKTEEISPLSFKLRLNSGKELSFSFEDLLYRMDEEETYISWTPKDSKDPMWCPTGSDLVGITIEKIS